VAIIVLLTAGGIFLVKGKKEDEVKTAQEIPETNIELPEIEMMDVEDRILMLLKENRGVIYQSEIGRKLNLPKSTVSAALNELQEKTNNQAEIIPGVITDERMGDRVQVIMILTGLGATAIDVPGFTQKITQAPIRENTLGKAISQPVMETHLVDAASLQTDLDIPAFLRRRIR